jgi:hypothetical protein
MDTEELRLNCYMVSNRFNYYEPYFFWFCNLNFENLNYLRFHSFSSKGREQYDNGRSKCCAMGVVEWVSEQRQSSIH